MTTEMKTAPKVTPAAELDTGLGDFRARGTDLAALGLTHENSARNVQFPVLTDGVTPTRLSIVNSAPGAHAQDGIVDAIGTLGHMQGAGFARSQSHPIEPHKFEVDLHDPANGPRALVLKMGAGGKPAYAFVAYKENLDLGQANPNN